MGGGYLNSEAGYIIMTGVPEYFFSSGESADLVSYAYDFTFTYGNNDRYTGTVYAAPEYGYREGYTRSTVDENGLTGTYLITAQAAGFDVGQAGQVLVNAYYDAESARSFTPVHAGSVVGTKYLTSEVDHIIQTDVPEYKFGGGYWEADLGAMVRYNFKFVYGSGIKDYYTGYVYARPDYGYYVGLKIYTNVENGNTTPGQDNKKGWYEITSGAVMDSAARYGSVYVTSYFDKDSWATYVPLYSNAAMGVNYLKSESGYILQDGVSAYYFGQGYYEADAPKAPRKGK
jgi:hypothetical protein